MSKHMEPSLRRKQWHWRKSKDGRPKPLHYQEESGPSSASRKSDTLLPLETQGRETLNAAQTAAQHLRTGVLGA